MQILTEAQEHIIRDERRLLSELRLALAGYGATPEDLHTLAESLEQLDDFFLLVVAGEFNAGKSALLNALLGQDVLREGATPTTMQVNILRNGQAGGREVVNEHLHILTAPAGLLEHLSVVDTPGTNAILREHELITERFLPRADLVLFVTSADRPFTESERAFLQRIRDWGKKIVLVINKIDILQNEHDLSEVQQFVRQNAMALLGIDPEIFPVSARLALKAKKGEPQHWQTSRFEALETYIQSTLDQGSRLRLKFLNPLGVAGHLLERYAEATATRLDLLTEDIQLMEDVERNLGVYREDMLRDFQFRMADIETVLFGMEQRGQDYFDEIFRLPRVIDLLNKGRIQHGFEEQVVADTPQQIERRVEELVDWLVAANLRQWQAVTDHLAERRRQYKDRLIGESLAASYVYDRERLIDGVAREAQRVVDTFNHSEEAQSLAEGAQNAVAATAAIEVGAVGLGAIITAMATTAAADVTGVVLAGVVAALGLIIIPARRRIAKQELRSKVGAMREQLVQSLSGQFEREIERSLSGLREAIAPYTRFVRSGQARLSEATDALERMQVDIARLKAEIEEIAEA